jgi:hypothetical protein
MRTRHPLTDKIIEEELITQDECDRRLDYGRANYYEEDFRTGADWQMDQVMNWLYGNLSDYANDTYLGDCESMSQLTHDLEVAMQTTQKTGCEDALQPKQPQKHYYGSPLR